MQIIASLQTRFSPQKMPSDRLCKNCKFFRTSIHGTNYGTCSKYGEQNLVTGEMIYDYASVARNHHCKGDYFVKKEGFFIRPLQKWSLSNDNDQDNKSHIDT
jgi:hypothetical protein